MHDRNETGSTSGRRTILKLLAAAGVTAIGAGTLFVYAPWLDYDGQALSTRRPLTPREALPGIPDRMRELVRYATLAASGHNTQPWRFSVREDAIEIRPDLTRRLPAVDPQDRELWISLGCALETFRIAAGADGLATMVTYPDAAEVIRVQLTADRANSGLLFDAIPQRQNTRSAYDGRPVRSADLDHLRGLELEHGVGLHLVTSPAELETVLGYVNQANLSQYADEAFRSELIEWVRFNRREAMATLDGLYSQCTGNPSVPQWLGRLFVARMKPQEQADADAAKLRSSAGVFLVTSTTDDRSAWVRTGQVYTRLALTMTSLGIRSAFLNQPIEIAAVRGQLPQALGLGASVPQLLVRFGHAPAMPWSLRRPVDDVIVNA
jgi:hypothetical protein